MTDSYKIKQEFSRAGRTPQHENGCIVARRFDVAVPLMVRPSPHLEFGAGA